MQVIILLDDALLMTTEGVVGMGGGEGRGWGGGWLIIYMYGGSRSEL